MDKEILINNLNLLQSSNDPLDLFKAMNIIISLSDEKILNEFILKKKDILIKSDPIKFIGYHVDFYVYQDKLKEGLEILELYQNAPFISLTCEDFMRDLHEELMNLLYPKKKDVHFSIDKLESDLLSSNEDKIMNSIKFLGESNVRNYMTLIENILVSKLLYKYKILLQFILIEQGVNSNICITKDDGSVFYTIPSKQELPFSTEIYKKSKEYIEKLNESPSIINMSIQVMNTCLVRMFPDNILTKYASPYIACEIFVYLAKEYMFENPNIDLLLTNSELDYDEIDKIIKYLKELLM